VILRQDGGTTGQQEDGKQGGRAGRRSAARGRGDGRARGIRLFAADLLHGHVADDGQLEPLALIRLEHEHDPENEPERNQEQVYRAIEILNGQVKPDGNPIWRPFTNEVRKLAGQWVLDNRRDPEELPELVRHGLGKAKGNPAAYIARIIESGSWEADAVKPMMDAEKAEAMERLRRHREQRAAAQ
jgi:hypothetical protein